MKVIATEVGNRPHILTKARRYAPQGIIRLAQMLGARDFADNATVVLDWSNVLGKQPEEVAIPVIVIQTSKKISEFTTNNNLQSEVRLDVEDLFGQDNITSEDLLDVVESLRVSMEESIARRRQQ